MPNQLQRVVELFVWQVEGFATFLTTEANLHVKAAQGGDEAAVDFASKMKGAVDAAVNDFRMGIKSLEKLPAATYNP